MNKLFSTLLLLLIVGAATANSSNQFVPTQADLLDYRDFFEDDIYSIPSKKMTAKRIKKITDPALQTLFQSMLDGTYQKEYRVQTYQKYLHPNVLAKQLKTSAYSQFENPTGIYFTEGEPVTLIVGTVKEVQLRITNFGKGGGDSTYELSAGMNTITPTNSGNGYIQFFTNSDTDLDDQVAIHIIGGRVNGYFNRQKHTNADWKLLLENASSEILDIVGERVHLAYDVESLKQYCPDSGMELISLYDEIISLQHDIMGLNKYNRVPKNHMLGRVIWKGFMHADHLGAAFHVDVMKTLADPKKAKTNMWGIAHEFGHVNQVRPWMKWVGTTEVTNNIYSVWTQYLFDTKNPKLEREVLRDYDGRIAGGRITSYMESSFIHKQPWLTQAGPDRWDRERPRDWGGDHFVKLVPFWQLQLYYAVAGEGNTWHQPDFYADIYIKAIDNEAQPKQDAEAQIAFMKNACDAAQTDLTDFFEISGMLRPIDLWVDDYTCAQMTITEQDITAVKQYAAKYKKPETPVLHYITANTVDYYKNKSALEGVTSAGFIFKDDEMIVNHHIWKNVVAFETYIKDELVKISFGGAGSTANDFTRVRMPEGTTTVEAVGWDGERKVVFRAR